jgi:hypothetical protein
MKNTIRAVVGGLCMLLGATAMSQMTLTAYETNNIFWGGTDHSGTVLSGGGIQYDLPFQGTAGWLAAQPSIYDPSLPTYQDLVYFDGAFHASFYSYAEDISDADAPADVTGSWPPGGFSTPNEIVIETELALEGWAQFDWTPANGQVGWDPVNTPTYIFVSDVPEPGTLGLVGLGLAGLAFKAHRRRNK